MPIPYHNFKRNIERPLARDLSGVEGGEFK
jgi:hypothetical protein